MNWPLDLVTKMDMHWTLYADGQIPRDQITIRSFNFSILGGRALLPSTSAEEIKLVREDGETIIGHEAIEDFIEQFNYNIAIK